MLRSTHKPFQIRSLSIKHKRRWGKSEFKSNRKKPYRKSRFRSRIFITPVSHILRNLRDRRRDVLKFLGHCKPWIRLKFATCLTPALYFSKINPTSRLPFSVKPSLPFYFSKRRSVSRSGFNRRTYFGFYNWNVSTCLKPAFRLFDILTFSLALRNRPVVLEAFGFLHCSLNCPHSLYIADHTLTSGHSLHTLWYCFRVFAINKPINLAFNTPPLALNMLAPIDKELVLIKSVQPDSIKSAVAGILPLSWKKLRLGVSKVARYLKFRKFYSYRRLKSAFLGDIFYLYRTSRRLHLQQTVKTSMYLPSRCFMNVNAAYNIGGFYFKTTPLHEGMILKYPTTSVCITDIEGVLSTPNKASLRSNLNNLSIVNSLSTSPLFTGSQVKLDFLSRKISKLGYLSYRFIFIADHNPYPSSYLTSIINKSAEYLFNKPTTVHFNFEFYNGLSLKEIVFLTSVTARLKLFAFKFSTIFFLSEFIDTVYLGLRRKNLKVVLSYLQRILKKLVLWDHKKFLVFFFSLFSEQFFPRTDFLRIVGFKISVRGKIAVGGNSRKRSMVLKLGNTRASLRSKGLDVTNSILITNTGALGIKTWLFYSHK